MAMDCEACGRTFKNSIRPGLLCFKCEKREAVERKNFMSPEAKKDALDEVEASRQCNSCGKVIKYLRGSDCDPCIAMNDKGKGKQPDPHAASAEVIEIESDYGNSSDVQEIEDAVPVLRDSINKHKQVASQIRLNAKPSSSSGLPAKSKEWLKRKKEANIAAIDPKKNGPIMFRCELFLQSETGKKVGTRVPMQSRGFQQSEPLDTVFVKFVAMFNETDGKWLQTYPNKLIQRDGSNAVQFTFKNYSDIPRKWKKLTVGEFWKKVESEPAGTYFKQADMTQRIASLAMLVPEEVVNSEDEPEEVSAPVTRKRKRNMSNEPQPVVKQEKTDIKLVNVKDEPIKSSSRALLSSAIKIRLNLNRPITYTKQVCSELYVIDNEDTIHNGTLSITPIRPEVLKRTFELTDTGSSARFLARRMDSVGQLLPEDELSVGQAELIRSVWLADMIVLLKDRASALDVKINDVSTPQLFLGIIQDSYQATTGINSNLVICQPYVNPASITVSTMDPGYHAMLETLSHLSYVQTGGQKLVTGFKMSNHDQCEVFAAVTHSITQDTGLGDEGPDGIAAFCHAHECCELCVSLGLPDINSL